MKFVALSQRSPPHACVTNWSSKYEYDTAGTRLSVIAVTYSVHDATRSGPNDPGIHKQCSKSLREVKRRPARNDSEGYPAIRTDAHMR